MIPQVIAIGKDACFTLKNRKTISGKILEADCTGKWCRVMVKSGDWKLIREADVKTATIMNHIDESMHNCPICERPTPGSNKYLMCLSCEKEIDAMSVAV